MHWRYGHGPALSALLPECLALAKCCQCSYAYGCGPSTGWMSSHCAHWARGWRHCLPVGWGRGCLACSGRDVIQGLSRCREGTQAPEEEADLLEAQFVSLLSSQATPSRPAIQRKGKDTGSPKGSFQLHFQGWDLDQTRRKLGRYEKLKTFTNTL